MYDVCMRIIINSFSTKTADYDSQICGEELSHVTRNDARWYMVVVTFKFC